MVQTFIIIVTILFVSAVFLLWFGLRVKPKPFPVFQEKGAAPQLVDLPADLPVPVAKFFRSFYGDLIPIYTSAIITGRAQIRLFGITFPSRFRFVHRAGRDYRHYIEATIFGFPFVRVNEFYLDGISRMETPGGVIENVPNVNQAANLGLWAESIWLPALFLTDERVKWSEIDEDTASVTVPFGDVRQTMVIRFDPETRMISHLEAMRYRDAADKHKTLWINQAHGIHDIGGHKVLSPGAVVWLDQGKPWAIFSVEEVVYNIDVADYVREHGI